MITDLLARPIAFQRPFVDLAGGVLPALMLSQALYWTPRTNDPDGWFWKTQEEWEDETGMKRWEQETARKKLRAVRFDDEPIWYEERRGVPAKLFYRIDTDILERWVATFLNAGFQHTGKSDSSIQDNVIPADIYTESTTETTPEITTEEERARKALYELVEENQGVVSPASLDKYMEMIEFHGGEGKDKWKAGWEHFVRGWNECPTNKRHIANYLNKVILSAKPDKNKDKRTTRKGKQEHRPSDYAGINQVDNRLRAYAA